MLEARIELLQRMPIFGGVGADILQFLLALCPIVSVPTNEFFFREHERGDSMFVLEMGVAAVLKSWRGQDHTLQTLKVGTASERWQLWTTVAAAPPSVQLKIVQQFAFQLLTSTKCTRAISSSLRSYR